MADWNLHLGTSSYDAWRGIAFETACLNNTGALRRALSLATMATTEFGWEGGKDGSKAQVDLVIERPDKVTHLCEMKFANEPYELSSDSLRELRHKREVFRSATGTRNSLQIVLVCAAGVKNSNRGGLDAVSWIVAGDDLFM